MGYGQHFHLLFFFFVLSVLVFGNLNKIIYGLSNTYKNDYNQPGKVSWWLLISLYLVCP